MSMFDMPIGKETSVSTRQVVFDMIDKGGLENIDFLVAQFTSDMSKSSSMSDNLIAILAIHGYRQIRDRWKESQL